MAPNPHALRVSRSNASYSYHEVRRATNILVAWDVADRYGAELIVEEWAAQGVDDLEQRAREEAECDGATVG